VRERCVEAGWCALWCFLLFCRWSRLRRLLRTLLWLRLARRLGGLGFVPVQPARVLDTRPGFQTVDELWAGVGSVGAGSMVTVRVGGRAGVPVRGVGSVVLNVTSVNATLPSFVSVFAAGTRRPVVSSLNPVPGVVASNLVVAPLSAAGEVLSFPPLAGHVGYAAGVAWG